jgi:phosphoribosylglycinamide formyltransferase 1
MLHLVYGLLDKKRLQCVKEDRQELSESWHGDPYKGHPMNSKIRIGALISGGGTNLQAIIDACEKNEIDGHMVFVGTDNPKAFGLTRAEKHGIPTFVVDYATIMARYRAERTDFKAPEDLDLQEISSKIGLFNSNTTEEKRRAFILTRTAAEAEILHRMTQYPFDLLVLAGFMRNLTPYFIDRVNTDPKKPKIMNIHPALLPAFPGTDGYGDTFSYGCKIGGCTVHFVDYGEDSGPIIGQMAYEIDPADTLEKVKKRGLSLEWELYPKCIQWFAEGRLRLEKRACRLSGNKTGERTVVTLLPAH